MGRLCLGDVRLDDNMHLNTCIDSLVNQILTSTYNHDLFEPRREMIPSIIYEEACKIADAQMEEEEIENDEKMFFILRGPHQRFDAGILQAWENLSSQDNIKDFLKKITWPSTFLYKDALANFNDILGEI